MESLVEDSRDFWFTLLRKDDTGDLWRPDLEIIFILGGMGRLSLENGSTEYTLRQGDIFVVNSFQMRALDLGKDALAISLTISSAFMAAMSPETQNVRFNCRSFLFKEDKQEPFDILRSDLANAFQVQYKNEMRHSLYLKSKIAALLEDLLRYFLDEGGVSYNESGRERLRAAIDYIHRNYRENITLEDLASRTYLSRTYISHSFQKHLGMSFTTYLTQIRLIHAARLMRGKDTLTEIAYNSGFPNVNAMIKAFRQYRGITPGAYRRRLMAENDTQTSGTGGTLESSEDVFSSLLKYAGDWHAGPVQKETVEEIAVDLNGRKQRLTKHWKRMINAGYASDLLNGGLREELTLIQRNIGFEYIRVKGMLDDDMCLLRLDIHQQPVVNFTYVDDVLDFILSIGAKPMIELGHMPEMLARDPRHVSMRAAITSYPKNVDHWERLIVDFMEHLDRRYGTDRVRQWLFSPWLTVDYIDFGTFTMEEYERIYTASHRAIKSVCKDFLTCGPGCIDHKKYMRQALRMFVKNDCVPDIITFRSFASVAPEAENSGLKLISNNESFYLAVNGDENVLYHSVREIHAMLREEGLGGLPLVLEEWSNNIWQRDLCNDTCYKSAYLFKNILENNSHLNGIGYFSTDDRLNEVPPSPDLFHGGFGLFAKGGIPKSAYRAMELLAQMGDRLLKHGEGYYITRNDREVQIFLYNCCHYDMLYRYRHTANMTKTDRYRVFNPKEPQAFHIQLDNAKPGKYRIRRYSISPSAGGSSYDAWVHMGAPDPLSKEEAALLHHLSHPDYRVETAVMADGESRLRIKADLDPHEVCLIKVNME